MGTAQCSIPVSILNGLSLLQTLRLSNVAIDEGEKQVLMLPRLHGLFLRRCTLSTSTTYELMAALNEYSVDIEEIDIVDMYREVEQYYGHRAVDEEYLYSRPIPIDRLSSLAYLSVSNCHLNAALTGCVERLTRLQILRLNNCILTAVPEALIKMHRMLRFTIYESIAYLSTIPKMRTDVMTASKIVTYTATDSVYDIYLYR